MFFARSGVVAATLLVLQSTLSIAAPLSDKAVHEFEKRISCHTNEIAKNNACVSCASLYTNATTCSRSAPLTCSYGEVNSKRQCAAVDCSTTPSTYQSTDAKQCLPCSDPHALTCNSTTPLSCLPDYTLAYGSLCIYGVPYARYPQFGLPKPYFNKQQPFKPFKPDNGNPYNCPIQNGRLARVIYYTGFFTGDSKCTGQNGAIDQNLVGTNDFTTQVLLKGFCEDYAKNPFVTANGADKVCQQSFAPPNENSE